MTDMTDERLAEIEARLNDVPERFRVKEHEDLAVLLAEVRRLREIESEFIAMCDIP